MSNILFDGLNEHFEPKEQEQKQDEWAGFKSYNVGGQRVIDLTSVDFKLEPLEYYDSIQRRFVYGTEAGNPNKL